MEELKLEFTFPANPLDASRLYGIALGQVSMSYGILPPPYSTISDWIIKRFEAEYPGKAEEIRASVAVAAETFRRSAPGAINAGMAVIGRRPLAPMRVVHVRRDPLWPKPQIFDSMATIDILWHPGLPEDLRKGKTAQLREALDSAGIIALFNGEQDQVEFEASDKAAVQRILEDLEIIHQDADTD
jgi:hypothetical protein